MWTVIKFLALTAVIATAILLPFAFVMSYLLTREPPNLVALAKRVVGKLFIPSPSSDPPPAPPGRRNI